MAAWGIPWLPEAADWIPLILRFEILEAWIWRLEAWMLAAGRIGGNWGRRVCDPDMSDATMRAIAHIHESS